MVIRFYGDVGIAQLGMAKPFPNPNYFPEVFRGISSSLVWDVLFGAVESRGVVLLKRPLLLCLPWIFGALCQREGNKKWNELWVNCQGMGALPRPHPGLEK